MNLKSHSLVTFALLFPLVLTGCGKGSPLPGGYAIFFNGGDDIGLVRPPKGEVLVGPKLAGIGNSGTHIFGEIQPPTRPKPNPAAFAEAPGFFIIDITTGAVERGLSREEWLKKLEKAGIRGEPELVPPEKKGPRL